ncbi:MAG: OmpA family protein [Syntrophales bacterium]
MTSLSRAGGFPRGRAGRFRTSGLVFVVFCMLAACAPKSQFILLPEPDGKVGRLEVRTQQGMRVLDQPWQSTEVTSGDRLPSEPKILDEREVREKFKDALAARPDPPVTYPKSQFVVLPEADGRVGRVEVATQKGSQVLDRAWQSTEVTSIDRLPSEPRVLDESQVRATFKDALEARPDPPVTYRVFFNTGGTELTASSRETIREVLAVIQARNPHEITVSGHTDAVGSADYNRTLSMKRARAIASLLLSQGVTRELIEISYHGKENQLVPTPDGVAELRNRRVEITIR